VSAAMSVYVRSNLGTGLDSGDVLQSGSSCVVRGVTGELRPWLDIDCRAECTKSGTSSLCSISACLIDMCADMVWSTVVDEGVKLVKLLLFIKDSWVGVCVGVGRWFEKVLEA